MSRTSADAVSIHAVLPESSANSDIAIEIHSPLASRAAGSRPTLGPVSYVQSPLVLQACDKEPSRVNVPFRTTGRAGASHQPSRPSTSAEQALDKRGRVERSQVISALTEADQLDRHAELALDRDDDPALGGPVELGEHDAGHVDDVGEDPGLAQPVLPGGRIEHQQDLRHGRLSLDHPLDLAELVHQGGLVLQLSLI